MPVKHDEIVQIVDRRNRKIDHRPRSHMRAEGLTHRASYIVVFNDQDEFFLQKRTANKDIYPSFWDAAAGGVVLADESYEVSAKRELFEELAVSDTPLHFAFDHYYEDGDNKVWGRVFTCRHNGPFVLQPSEIAGGMFISLPEALRLKDREPFTPDSIEILRKLHVLRQMPMHSIFFLHGHDSSGQGTKGQFFQAHFPHVHRPNFTGNLADRLQQLQGLCQGIASLTLIGSSFGGLMATCYAAQFPEKTARLILLAPALNFGDFQPPPTKLQILTRLIIGKGDTVTPPGQVIPLAKQTFANLEVSEQDDDHMLHQTMPILPWHELLMR